MTPSITAYYHLSDQGQRAALLAGLPAQRTQTISVPVTPYWLANASIDHLGLATVAIGCTLRKRDGALEVYQVTTSSDRILDSLTEAYEFAEACRDAAVKADLAARRADKAYHLAWVERLPPEVAWLPEVRALVDALDPRYGFELPTSSEMRVLRENAERAEQRDRADRARAEYAAEESARAAETAAERAAELAWIGEHGSPRLRALAAHDLEYATLYEEERLVIDRPGWAHRTDDAVPIYTERDPYLPSLADLELLDLAHSIEPSAQIRRVTVYRHDPEDPNADSDGDVEQARGHAIRGEYRGRQIWLLASFPA